MNEPRRIVFDTNVIVSALLFEHSTPGRALQAALKEGRILTSVEIVEELSVTLSKKKFDRYLTRDERERFLQGFVSETTLVDVTTEVHACRDPDDDKYLALAVDGQAACIVSGDEDLLVLKSFNEIPILTPEQFIQFLERLC